VSRFREKEMMVRLLNRVFIIKNRWKHQLQHRFQNLFLKKRLLQHQNPLNY
ncbi:hypothetical protein PanWU01x14_351740, partial [Parasponia andersonii]